VFSKLELAKVLPAGEPSRPIELELRRRST